VNSQVSRFTVWQLFAAAVHADKPMSPVEFEFSLHQISRAPSPSVNDLVTIFPTVVLSPSYARICRIPKTVSSLSFLPFDATAANETAGKRKHRKRLMSWSWTLLWKLFFKAALLAIL